MACISVVVVFRGQELSGQEHSIRMSSQIVVEQPLTPIKLLKINVMALRVAIM